MIWFYRILQFNIGFGEVYLCFMVLEFLLERRVNIRKYDFWTSVAPSFLTVLASVNREIALYSGLLTVFLIVSIFLCAKYLYIASTGQILLILLLYYVILNITEFMFVFFLGHISGDPFFASTITLNHSIWRLIVFFLPRALMFIGYYWMCKVFRGRIEDLKDYRNIFLIIIIIGIPGIYYFQDVYISNISKFSKDWFIYLFVTLNVTIILLFKKIYNKERDNARYMANSNDFLQYNYKKLFDSHRSNSIMYHDMKNHLSAVRHYIINCEPEKALEYLDGVQAPINKFNNFRFSDNEIIDFILNYKLAAAKKENIEVSCDIDVMKEMAIGDAELCALLTNLIDNCIEACKFIKEDKRWIDIVIKCINNMLVIKISNSCSGEPVKVKNKLITNKAETEFHGIGLLSIKNIVSKYSGIYEDHYENYTFNTNITLFY